MANVLIVDDEKSIRRTLRDILELEKYKVDEASDGLDCIVKLKQNNYDVIILDIKMPKMDGMEALQRINQVSPETPVVMISGHGTIDTAVEAVKNGAFDFISKPPDLNRLLITLRNAMDKSTLITEKKVLQRKVKKKKIQEIIGESPEIKNVNETIAKVAKVDTRVLITGSNGTGKELVARWIHEKSNRSDNPLVEVNCAAIPSELIESELFGHEKGSFTSAHKQRIGKFEEANQGTLFLDEIGDMSLSAQAKVLRALQENRITRVGGNKDIQVDVRILSATNKDLQHEIAKGTFREDLYHRLSVIIVKVPALNDRATDIPILVDHFLDQVCAEYNIPTKSVDPGAMKLLQKINWTGNIRELRNVIERLVILGDEKISKNNVELFAVANSNQRTSLQNIFEKHSSFDSLVSHLKQEYEQYKGIVV